MNTITSAQAQLLEFLRESKPTADSRAMLRRNPQELVWECGWWYEPAEVPERIDPGTPQECHKNAALLTLDDDSLIYCEGYALYRDGSSPRIHAWVTDGQGRAIDNTWPQPGVAYAGIPFQGLFVTLTFLKNNAAISLLDGCHSLDTLRGELAHRPEEWLEPQGRGVARIKAGLGS